MMHLEDIHMRQTSIILSPINYAARLLEILTLFEMNQLDRLDSAIRAFRYYSKQAGIRDEQVSDLLKILSTYTPYGRDEFVNKSSRLIQSQPSAPLQAFCKKVSAYINWLEWLQDKIKGE
jgi:hypothetical protein